MAPKPQEAAPLVDLVPSADSTEEDSSTIPEKRESGPAKAGFASASDYPTPVMFLRTIVAASLVAYALNHFELFEAPYYWFSVFAIAMTMELSEPSVHNFAQYIYPVVLTVQTLHAGNYPNYLQMSLMIPSYLLLVGVPMSVCLHRYFSHAAFETTRFMQFLLGVVSTFAYQGGPLWWSAKHVRHHHHCDQPLDPHSVVQKGYFYAFLGWTCNPANTANRDRPYNNPALLVPELLILDKLYELPPILLFWFLEYHGVSRAFIAHSILGPMLMCRIVTLLFNVEYHPAHDADSRRCKSIDQPQILADVVGESHHEIHHRKPALCKRSNRDIPYWITIYWMEPVGLIWNCR